MSATEPTERPTDRPTERSLDISIYIWLLFEHLNVPVTRARRRQIKLHLVLYFRRGDQLPTRHNDTMTAAIGGAAALQTNRLLMGP